MDDKFKYKKKWLFCYSNQFHSEFQTENIISERSTEVPEEPGKYPKTHHGISNFGQWIALWLDRILEKRIEWHFPCHCGSNHIDRWEIRWVPCHLSRIQTLQSWQKQKSQETPQSLFSSTWQTQEILIDNICHLLSICDIITWINIFYHVFTLFSFIGKSNK